MIPNPVGLQWGQGLTAWLIVVLCPGAISAAAAQDLPEPIPTAATTTHAAADTETSTAPPLELELRADHLNVETAQGRTVAVGNVKATLAGGRLMADRLDYDGTSRSLLARGRVRFQRGQQLVQASELRYSLLEGVGEITDAYGVLDLDSSATDLNPETLPTPPLPPPEPMACPPALAPAPQWHPYPWAVTAWGGQMVDTNFGDTFLFRGRMRPEVLGGVGLQRRLLDGGPFSLEFDSTLMGHNAARQRGGEFNNHPPNSNVPAQSFGELTGGLGLRVWLRPWLNLFVVEGVSLNTEVSNYEKTFRENYARLLNYLGFEMEALVTPQVSLVGRIHHRSGAFGTYSGVREGSNAYLVGLRYRFGQDTPSPRFATPLPPPEGCPEAVAPPMATTTRGNAWQRARILEQQRERMLAQVDQRVEKVTFQQSLIAERRFGFPRELTVPDTVNEYGGVRPEQLKDLTTVNNRKLLRGSISRWRFQAHTIRIEPDQLVADRAALTNDPFTPAQAWLNAENLRIRRDRRGDTLITADRTQVVLEQQLPIPAVTRTRLRRDEVENRLVVGVDEEDRDGLYAGYAVNPIRLGERGRLNLQPQVMVQRAINGSTNSYPKPGQPAWASPKRQPADGSDLVGLVAELRAPLLGFDLDGTLDMSTFNPANVDSGTRSWGNLSRRLTLPLLGESTLRLFGAYRYRIWNGSLGEEDVYTAYGASLEDTGTLPNWGQLRSTVYWRAGSGRFQAVEFDDNRPRRDRLIEVWRSSAIGSINSSINLWSGQPLPATPLQGLRNTPVPVVPGLDLNTNLTGILAAYSDGRQQNTLSLSAGPTLTLGHFSRPFLDYTQITVTGGGTLRQGGSPLSFDRAVDLGTLNLGLVQQIAGPLVFSGGIGFNVDGNSRFYGDVTGSYVELRWQRRSYEIGVYFSPYEGLGGVRIRLNDFNFSGPGLPFIPYHPIQAVQQRPF
ncbi:MAG: DUF3769 domain-containing protein [Cyanobacteriota bacterium]|nr:DUF3769 domain-containing protein [Cyanobacteriota bacterium]